MKKLTLTMVALMSLFLLFSCNKDKKEAGKAVFTASIEQQGGQGDAKTALNPANGQIKWLSGDQIVITNGNGETSVFNLQSGAGTTNGIFNTSNEFDLTVPFKAAYPSSAVINGNKVSFVLPSTQELGMNVGTFANGANPMVACSDNENLSFKNLCGGLGIRLQGDNVHIDGIRITSCDENEKLNGAFEVVDCTVDEPVLVPADGNTGTNVITLTCDVILSATTASEFFIVLPVGTLAQGFTMEVLDGEEILATEEMDSGLAEVVRNGIKSLNAIEIEGESSYYQVYGSTNPYDQIIALIYTQDHDSIMVYGDKDANALPIGIRELVIHQHEAEGRMVIEFDDQSRPINFIAPNGVKILLEWLDESSAALTVIYLPTGEQFNTIAYFDKGRQERISHPSNIRSGNVSMAINNDPKPRLEKENKIMHNGSRSIEGSLFGYACGGMQSWGDYYVNVFRVHGSHYSFIGRLPCYHVVDNRYRYDIPEGYFSHHNINAYDICDATVSFLGNVCTGLEGPTITMICTTIAAASAFISDGLSAVASAQIFTVCEEIGTALAYYCMTLGNSPGPGSPTIGDQFCELFMGIEYSWTDPIYLSPYVKVLPNDIMGQGTQYDGIGTPNPLFVDSGGEPSIDVFELIPSAPIHGQSYNAIAHCSCIPGGSRITMSIVGTDGYTNSKTIFISTNNEHVDATLYVPGAASGVHDVCTVVVTLPDGSTLPPKTAALDFH
jgi:hypothetical protein